jgi:BolA protein
MEKHMTASERLRAIQQQLTDHLQPIALQVMTGLSNTGHAHSQGKGHYTVRIQASAFNGLKSVEKHRLVFKALGDLMDNEIHALIIKAQGTWLRR